MTVRSSHSALPRARHPVQQSSDSSDPELILVGHMAGERYLPTGRTSWAKHIAADIGLSVTHQVFVVRL